MGSDGGVEQARRLQRIARLRQGHVGHAHAQHAEQRQFAAGAQQRFAEDEGRDARVLQRMPRQMGIEQVVGAIGHLHADLQQGGIAREHTPGAAGSLSMCRSVSSNLAAACL